MSEALHSITSIEPPFNMIVLIILICSIAGVFTTVFKELRKYACHRQEIEFKRELVDRGMAADEIERVIRSRDMKESKS